MGWLVAGAVILAFNTLLGASGATGEPLSAGNRLAFAFGQAIALTLIVAPLALLSPSNRNPRSLGKVLFWTQVLGVLLAAAR
jgi:hypothetical protein